MGANLISDKPRNQQQSDPEYAVIFQNQLNNPFCALFIIKALQGESIKYSPSIFYTGSKNVSGCPGSKISLQVMTVTRSSVSDRLIIL